MRKITKLICAAMAAVMLLLSLASCDRKPGLYAWYGRVKVDYILKLTVDAGDGEKTYDVPFDKYRNLFVYYQPLVSDVIKKSEDSQLLVTDDQKTAVLKEYTEDELCEYYSLVAIAEKYGFAITDADREKFQSDYAARIEQFKSQINDEDRKNFRGTDDEYARYLYEKVVEKLGMTDEYIEYLYYKNILTKRVKQALLPELRAYTEQSYYHFKQVYIEYTKGDDAQEKAAYENILKAYEELRGGASMDDVMTKYNQGAYGGEFYFDSYGSIVASATSNSLGQTTTEAIKAIPEGSYGEIMMGDGEDGEAYFAIVQRLGFDDTFIYGTSEEAEAMFKYAYVGASSYSVNYMVYTDILEAYKQNMRIEPYDAKVYKLVRYKTVY